MKHLKILADDVTGAADTAARCRQFGMPATIFLGVPASPLPPGALAFTSDSRHLRPEEAARRTREVAASIPASDARWYKKIDSTVRGNIGSEVDALLDLLDEPAAVVCPAFPAHDRGLRDGYLEAPGFAPRDVHLPSLLCRQSRYPVGAIPLPDVRGGELAAQMKCAQQEIAGAADSRRLLLVVDALSEEDLDGVVRAQQEALPDALLCGSAGLAGALARRIGPQAGLPEAGSVGLPATQDIQPRIRTALLVMGSGSRAAHRQIAFLLDTGSKLQTGKQSRGSGPQLSVSRMLVSPETGPDAVAALDPAQGVWLLQQPLPEPGAVLEGKEARRRADHLAGIGAAAFERRRPDLLVLVGGDTAMPILERLGVELLTVTRELLPGMPLCSAVIGGRPALVSIKPGNFGGRDTLLQLLAVAG
ncbi:MAG: hypothetical protein OXO48_10505 [Caldilineaceae bacterium]|nr:hypothetical protein [Caldilineaceae bacterium]MDE0070137.1 hypothetical protein [Caldilineaceae bacterium]